MYSGQHASTKEPSILRSVLNIIVIIAMVLGLSWALSNFVFKAYEIPSGSMETTIMPGDRLFSEKITYYFEEPQAGQIVTFNDPQIPSRILIKRVIATGGQQVDLRDGYVYVDGVQLEEPYTNGLPSYELTPVRGLEISYPYTVPEGELWVMGDNRTNSQDSRYFGSIPVSSVTGKAALIYWPFSNFGLVE